MRHLLTTISIQILQLGAFMRAFFSDLAEFGDLVRRRRNEERLSQSDLAKAVGISRVYLSQIERGVAANLSNAIAKRLIEYLGIVPVAEGNRKRSSTTLPEGLREFQEACRVSDADVAMLATLQFRGKKPKTKEQWKQLYNIIKATSVSWD